MQRFGFEWFYRFLMVPRRLLKRYFIDGTRYFALTLGEGRKCQR